MTTCNNHNISKAVVLALNDKYYKISIPNDDYVTIATTFIDI